MLLSDLLQIYHIVFDEVHFLTLEDDSPSRRWCWDAYA